ncbi:DNA polymerase III subunit gamma/tau [Acidicapsa acidisoli]|uniref:DNA polymerase III subunit gamma/tau n=1 Tax=Acidicapsa acidisoli TaxID=1615681 RepID=UPI0021E08799|nr:DNA polymerase III subunit gamma/tau [Acidicapsa acidisoli]
MGYQVLARKYRPQRFADVAGQDHVTRTLTNALNQQRIAHGYIFSGHRGIGKTTIARILAQALNCRNAIGTPERPTAEPCGECDSCREIRQGNAVDVIEIDAATNRGIDEIRELRDAARYSPSRDRYKIYILDEAHQITDAAFNALLKTLEEPPSHVIFMMATTEPESIPQTIRSRCQHFSFHAVKFDDILAQLKSIAINEDVSAEEAALALLAEAGDGSMRDALSIMDQAIASAPLENAPSGNPRPVLQTDQIRELMGSVPNAVFERLMEAVSAQQSARLMEDLDKLLSSGNSPSALSRQLVRYLRNCLMAKLGGENTSLLEIAHDERARAARTAVLFSEEELTRNLQIALRTFDELNYRQEQRFHLELGLLKLIQAQRLLPMEEILSGMATQNPAKRPNLAPSSPSASSVTTPSRPIASAASPARPAAPTPPSISPFAASNQRIADVPSSLPVRDLPPASTNLTPVAPPAPQPAKVVDLPPEPATVGALALSEPAQEVPLPAEPAAESGPQIVPPLASAIVSPPPPVQPTAASSGDSGGPGDIDNIRSAVAQALTTGGHATAATLIEDGKWNVEGSSVRIEVNAKATMIRLTFNAAAEKLIRQGLSQAGAPSRFMIVPGEGLTTSGGSAKVRAPLGSIENEARSNPLVVQAQAVFNAEIVTVIDLREK